MTKNNSKNWLEIEEEFKKKYFHRGIPGYELRHVEMCKEFLGFFKTYFQEQRHTEAVEELEIGICCTQCDNNKPRVPGGILMLCEKCFKKLQGK